MISLLKGTTSAQAAARKHGLPTAEIEEWRERFLRQYSPYCGRAPGGLPRGRGGDREPIGQGARVLRLERAGLTKDPGAVQREPGKSRFLTR